MKNNFIFIIFDSCRFDTFDQAKTPNIDKLGGPAERRWAFASWTVPSHAVYLMGISPHTVRSYIKEGYRILETYDDVVYPPDLSPQERWQRAASQYREAATPWRSAR